MDLYFDHQLYNKSHVPSETVIRFLVETLPYLGWSKGCTDEIMDVGCGDGGMTVELILPLFPRTKKIIAFDTLPGMIDVARRHNSHSQIQYHVADIQDWSTLHHWKSQMTKLLSIHCFHWVKDQKIAFHNSYRLLKPSGEAAFVFFLEASFFTAFLQIQNNPKWSHFFNKVDNYIPDSHHKKHNVSYYRTMLEDVGFNIIYAQEKRITDILPSDEEYINFFSSICVLVKHVPEEKKEEFRRDLFQEILRHNGRDRNGLPFHSGKLMELVVRKN